MQLAVLAGARARGGADVCTGPLTGSLWFSRPVVSAAIDASFLDPRKVLQNMDFLLLSALGGILLERILYHQLLDYFAGSILLPWTSLGRASIRLF